MPGHHSSPSGRTRRIPTGMLPIGRCGMCGRCSTFSTGRAFPVSKICSEASTGLPSADVSRDGQFGQNLTSSGSKAADTVRGPLVDGQTVSGDEPIPLFGGKHEACTNAWARGGVGHTPVHGTGGSAVRLRRPVVLPDVPVELLDGPFDAVALARARALGLDVVELAKMRGKRRLLRAGLPSRYEVEPALVD